MELKIFDDESIHSYFIRTLLCSGMIHASNSLRGIVSDSGVIRTLPRVSLTKASIFSELADGSLEKLITLHSTYSGLKFYHIDEVRGFIFFDKNFSALSYPPDADSYAFPKTQLRYCPQCFKEQITQYGVSWFRVSWLYSIECSLHSKHLYHVKRGVTKCCGRGMNIYSELLSALRGKCNYCSKCAWSNGSEVYIGGYNRDQYFVLRNNNQELQDRYRDRHEIKKRELEYSRIRVKFNAMKEERLIALNDL